MPRTDLYHNQVKHALVKEGWKITLKKIISDQQIKLLVFDPETEEIIQWIS
ncbi:MAG: element excision factor XisH family protein [Pseudomonadota bacterium]